VELRGDVPIELDGLTVRLPTRFNQVKDYKGGIPNAHTDPETFFQILADHVTVSKLRPVNFFPGHQHGPFDGGFLFLDAATNQSYLVLWDAKDRLTLGETSQYEQMKKLQKLVPAHLGGAAEALRDGRFCYVYFTTAPGTSYIEGDLLVLHEKESRRFLGPISAMCQAVRSAYPDRHLS
jgi:hypothetical protein